MKYILIAEPEYNEDKQCKEVEFTEEEIELIKSRLQPDFTGFEWDVENRYWQKCSNLQEKIGGILDNE